MIDLINRETTEDVSIDDFEQAIFSISKVNNVYLFGAGKIGNIVAEYLDEKNIHWVTFIDNALAGARIKGKMIIHLDNVPKNNSIILVTVIDIVVMAEIYEQLIKSKFADNQIILMENTTTYAQIFARCTKNKAQILNVQKFKKIHEGKRCFIIGNGPSLTIEDIEKLRGEICFASNRIIHVFEKTKWRPTYLAMVDDDEIKLSFRDESEVRRLTDNCDAVFTSVYSQMAQKYSENPKMHYMLGGFRFHGIKDRNSFLSFIKTNNIEEDIVLPEFSKDVTNVVYGCGTVTYRIYQLAVYMGIEEIYLLGMDNSYASVGKKENRLDYSEILNDGKIIANGRNTLTCSDTLNNIVDKLLTLAHLSAKRFAENNHIKIINVSRGGKLEVFERKQLEEVV